MHDGSGLNEAEIDAIERYECERSLVEFIRSAWPHVDPGRYVHGWHVEAIAEHLEAVSRGEIGRLYIAVPPGTMKSLMTSVFWPCWEWTTRPETRVLATAHNERLAVRDNLKARRLIQSAWFQRLWPLALTSDQNAKTKFENDRMGFREAMPFTSMTGSRGDRLNVDDPLSVDDAGSQAKREAVITTFSEALPTRLNDPERSSITVIQQRLHERDVIGFIEAKNLGYEALVLPMEFEAARRCRTSIGFEDPRTEEGELLFPQRFPREVIERDRKVMGSYAWAGQMQQRPAPREGGMFKRSWFEIVDAAPANARRVRRWDLAATSAAPGGDPDWTVGLKMAEADGVYYVEHVERMRESAAKVEAAIVNTAKADGIATMVRLPQDPGQAGKAQAAYLVGKLAGFDARATPETGSKEVRATPVSAQAEAGNVKLVRGPWVEAFLEEVSMFPNAAHDDQVDALAGAFGAMQGGKPFEWYVSS